MCSCRHCPCKSLICVNTTSNFCPNECNARGMWTLHVHSIVLHFPHFLKEKEKITCPVHSFDAVLHEPRCTRSYHGKVSFGKPETSQGSSLPQVTILHSCLPEQSLCISSLFVLQVHCRCIAGAVHCCALHSASGSSVTSGHPLIFSSSHPLPSSVRLHV